MPTTPLTLELAAKSGSLEFALDRLDKQLTELITKSQKFAASLTFALQRAAEAAKQTSAAIKQVVAATSSVGSVAGAARAVGSGGGSGAVSNRRFAASAADARAAQRLQQQIAADARKNAEQVAAAERQIAEKAARERAEIQQRILKDQEALVDQEKVVQEKIRRERAARRKVDVSDLTADQKFKEKLKSDARRLQDEIAAAEREIAEKAARERAAISARVAAKESADQKLRVKSEKEANKELDRVLKQANRDFEKAQAEQAQLAKKAAAERKKVVEEARREFIAAQKKADAERVRLAKKAAADQKALQDKALRQEIAAARERRLLLESEANRVQNRIESFASRAAAGAFGLLEQTVRRVVNVLTDGGLEAAFTRAADFEKNLADVGSLLSKEAAPNLIIYRDAIKGIALTTSKNLVDLTRGLYEAISAGADPAAKAGGALDIVNQAQRAAVAGLAETEEAVKAGTIVFNTFGKSVGNAETVFNKLFEAVNIGVFTFPQLADSIGRVANIAASSGVSFDVMLGGIASISKGGVSAAESVTQLSRLIIAIINPTKEAAKAAKQLGIDLSPDRLRKPGGLQDIVRDLAKLTKDRGTEALKSVVGGRVEAFRAALSLIREGGAAFDRDVNSITIGVNALDRAFEQQSQKIGFQLGLLRNKFDVLAADVFQKVEPVLVGLLKDVGNALSGLDSNKVVTFFTDLANSIRSFVQEIIKARETTESFFNLIIGFVKNAVVVGGFIALTRVINTLRAAMLSLGATSAATAPKVASVVEAGKTSVRGLPAQAAPGAAASAAAVSSIGQGASLAVGSVARLTTAVFIAYEAFQLLVAAGNALGDAIGRAAETAENRLIPATQRASEIADRISDGVDKQQIARKGILAQVGVSTLEELRKSEEISAARKKIVQGEIKALEQEVKDREAALGKKVSASEAEYKAAQEALANAQKQLDIRRGIINVGRELNDQQVDQIVVGIRKRQDANKKEEEFFETQRKTLLDQAEKLRKTIATIGLGDDSEENQQRIKKLNKELADLEKRLSNVTSYLDGVRALGRAFGELLQGDAGTVFGKVQNALQAEFQRLGTGGGKPKSPGLGGGKRKDLILTEAKSAAREELQLEKDKLAILDRLFKDELANRKIQIAQILGIKAGALFDETANEVEQRKQIRDFQIAQIEQVHRAARDAATEERIAAEETLARNIENTRKTPENLERAERAKEEIIRKYALREINIENDKIDAIRARRSEFVQFVENRADRLARGVQRELDAESERDKKAAAARLKALKDAQKAQDKEEKKEEQKSPFERAVELAEKSVNRLGHAIVDGSERGAEFLTDSAKAFAETLPITGVELGNAIKGAATAAGTILQVAGAAASAAMTAGLSLLINAVVGAFQKLISLAGEFSAKAGDAEFEKLRLAQRARADLGAKRAGLPRRLQEAQLRSKIEEAKAKNLSTFALEEELTKFQAESGRIEAAEDVTRIKQEDQDLARDEALAARDEAEAQRAIDLGPFRIAVEEEIRKLGLFVANLLTNLPNLIFQHLLKIGSEIATSIISSIPTFVQTLLEGILTIIPNFIGAALDILIEQILSGEFIVKLVEAIINGLQKGIEKMFDKLTGGLGGGIVGGITDFAGNLNPLNLFHSGGYADKVKRYASGGFTQAVGSNITARQQSIAQSYFNQIRNGAIPALLERGELMVPPDIAQAVGGQKVPIPGAVTTGTPPVQLNIVARGDMGALVQKLIERAFVTTAQQQGANVRTARDVVENGEPVNLPRPIPFLAGS